MRTPPSCVYGHYYGHERAGLLREPLICAKLMEACSCVALLPGCCLRFLRRVYDVKRGMPLFTESRSPSLPLCVLRLLGRLPPVPGLSRWGPFFFFFFFFYIV